MDDREKAEEQAEDLEPSTDDAEDVKGGAGGTFTLTFQGQTTSPRANNDPNQAGRGGWDGNHNETLVVI
jgi:hypothetical protein